MGKNCKFYADIMSMHDEVTGSCNLVVVKYPDGESTRFIVDCGLFNEREYDELNNQLIFDSEKIDFTLITHVHVDHVGRLPFMVQNGYNNPIYCTKISCILMPIVLKDSLKILTTIAKLKHKKALYYEVDEMKTEDLLCSVEYGQTIHPTDNIKVTFFQNGHLFGAALILVQISYPEQDDINLLFTGDYKKDNIFFDVAPLPNWVLDLPITIVQESTYGKMYSSEMKAVFRENVMNCIENNGTALVLVFSLGRAQEILYKLKVMQDDGILSKDIPIYLDGKLAQLYTNMCKNLDIKEEMQNYIPSNFKFVTPEIRNILIRSCDCKIVLTTSGMGSQGPAQEYIPALITRKNVLIHFTGYTAPGTLGYKLKNAESGNTVEINGLILKKRAIVEYSTEDSAHAKLDQIIDFLKQFNNLKLVLFNHGSEEAKINLANIAIEEADIKAVGILSRKYFFRVDAYGLRKSLTTKFD